ncbi:MATE efflux family protein [Euphorbia peplus]|nr:MATE efflux family protein [Euphorbia peplus]
MEDRLLGNSRTELKLKERIWEENKKIWKVGLPAMLARVTQYGMVVVTQAFIGNLGENQLAAYALIQIISIRFAIGFSSAAFSELFPLLKLSVSSGVMLCLETWYNAVLVLLAGYMKNATTLISALSICLNVTGWEFMFCLAFLVSSSVRVSNELGKGDANAAKFAIKVIISISIIVGVVFFVLCLALDQQIARIFTNVEAVIEAVSKLSVLLAFSVLLNSFQTVLTGVAIGAGRQSMVAYINITSYYFVGVPLGIVLGYVANLQIQGIWIGMIVGVVMQVSILGYITSTTDWNEQIRRASERLDRFMTTSNYEDSERERLIK